MIHVTVGVGENNYFQHSHFLSLDAYTGMNKGGILMNNSSHSNPLNSPEAAALLKDKGALKKLLSSPEAKKLMSMLSSQDTSQLKSAAEQAKNGDTATLMSMVNGIMDRPGGAQLMRKFEQKFPGKKS